MYKVKSNYYSKLKKFLIKRELLKRIKEIENNKVKTISKEELFKNLL